MKKTKALDKEIEKKALKQLLNMDEKEFENAIFDAIESDVGTQKVFEKEYQGFITKMKKKINPKVISKIKSKMAESQKNKPQKN